MEGSSLRNLWQFERLNPQGTTRFGTGSQLMDGSLLAGGRPRRVLWMMDSVSGRSPVPEGPLAPGKCNKTNPTLPEWQMAELLTTEESHHGPPAAATRSTTGCDLTERTQWVEFSLQVPSGKGN